MAREFTEETESEVSVKENYGCYDFLLNSPYNGCDFTQHIAQFYGVSLINKKDNKLQKILYSGNDSREQEENDSAAC